MKTTFNLALFAALPLLALGCAHRQVVPAPIPTPTPQNTTVSEGGAAWDEGPVAHYSVKPGDCLWTIAARKRVFGDPWAWPLLYRENRDQIQDPNLIYTREYLNYTPHATREELARARRIADATPPYHRKELPVR